MTRARAGGNETNHTQGKITIAERKITMNAQKCSNLALHLTCAFLAALFGLPSVLNAQGTPSLVDRNLCVHTAIENLDAAHLTSSILRFNPDDTTPADNPSTGIGHVFVARLEGRQEVPPNTSRAKGFAAFLLNQEGTALRFFVFVTGLDFTGTQTADPSDNLVAAHIHAPAPRGANAGVVFGFFGQPFNDINPNDVVVTPFARGVGGTIFSKWDRDEGNNTTLTAQLPNILAGLSYINFHTNRFPSGEIRGQID
jgi:CHRD domain